MADALAQLRELFGDQDEEVLRAVLSQTQDDVPRAVEMMLEIKGHGAANGHNAQTVPNTLGLLSEAAMLSEANMSAPSSPAPATPTRGSNPLAANVVQMKQQQLYQVQRYLHAKGLPRMSVEERKQYLTANPTAVAELKQFLGSIGLGQYNFVQLQQYFKESGLSLFGQQQQQQQHHQQQHQQQQHQQQQYQQQMQASRQGLQQHQQQLFQQQMQPRDPLLRQLIASETRGYEQYMFNNTLTMAQKQQFREFGFVLVSNAVSRPLVDAAVREINRTISTGFSPEDRLRTPWCADLKSSACFLDLLYRSPALAYAMSLTGAVARVQEAAIDIQFPGAGCIDRNDPRIASQLPPGVPFNHYVPDPHWQRAWVVDDIGEPGRCQACNYTLLVGVLLNDLPHALNGNPTIFPGTHHAFQATMQRAGGSQAFLEKFGIDELRRQIPTHDGVQIAGSAGDILLMHYATAHTVAPNVGPNIRYMAIFKLFQANHVPGVFRPEAMDKIWLEYEGLKDLRPPVPISNVPGRFCPRCNSGLDANARFCQYCGQPMA